VPADVVLELAPHQVLSAGLQAWVAETGAELPFRQAAERLERLTGIGLGVETVRTHTQQVGIALVERQQRAAASVLQTQEPAEAVDAAPDVLVIEADGVLVHYRDGWHEVKVGEVAGCHIGNGRPASDPTARSPELVAPELRRQPYLSSRVWTSVAGRSRTTGWSGDRALAAAAGH